ncbi:MAG: hypothetical protein AB8B73_14140 [Ekhidna sp.]
MKKILLLFILLTPMFSKAQLFEGDEYEYNSEWIWGINKNSNGGFIGGFVLRYARSMGNDFYETFGVELSNVKHPSESRFVGSQGQGFNYGKTNYLYAIRLQYGREKLLFRKADQKGVQINAGAAVGPTIGLENPYYVLVGDNVYKQFDPDMTPGQIQAPGKLFQGLGESKVVPGINAKGSISFEFGTYKSNVLGVEVGTMLEVYTRTIIINPRQENNSVFSSVFFTIFWGTRN